MPDARSTTLLVLLVVLAAGCSTRGPVIPRPAIATVAAASALRAGVSRVKLRLPAGVPLAGYGSAGRRLKFPDVDPRTAATWFKPAVGRLDAPHAKALVLANDTVMVAMLTVDTVGMLGELADRIHATAVRRGATIARDNLMVMGSHTHSGPGTMTGLKFWEIAGSDKLSRNYRDIFVSDCAQALVAAELTLQPAKLGIASAALTGVTRNRRAGVSPHIQPDMVDEELGVIRVDTVADEPLAILWNFAIHGTAYPPGNLRFSADVMGAVSALVERDTGATALFANGAEGDTVPVSGGAAGIEALAPIISRKIQDVAAGITPVVPVTLASASTVEPFGKATLDLSRKRLDAGSTGLDLPEVVRQGRWNPRIVLEFNRRWFENDYRFQAFRVNDTLILPVPGEPIYFVGRTLKSEGAKLGFARVLVFGLANGHMAYITTEEEYAIGGYEGIATFFGPTTASRVHAAAMRQAQRVKQ